MIKSEIKDEKLKKLLDDVSVFRGEDKNIADELFSDGYVTLQGTNMGDVCTITPKGIAFIKQGGYSALEQNAIKEKETHRQMHMQELEMQHIISEKLMEKDHDFQARQNQSNRRNNIISGIIAAIVTLVIQVLIMVLKQV